MAYSIEFRPAVLNRLKRFPKKDLVRIKKKIEELGQNLPDPNTTKMKGNNSFHKIRTGDYRGVKNGSTRKKWRLGHQPDPFFLSTGCHGLLDHRQRWKC